MAIKVSTAARGNAKATGMMKTPKARVFTAGPDIVSQERGPGGGAYGENHYTGASSATMDKIPQSPMAAALRVGDDGVLNSLIAKGSAKSDAGDLRGSPQTRDVSNEPYAVSGGMVRQQNPDRVYDKANALPKRLGAIDSDFLARRDAGVKRTQ